MEERATYHVETDLSEVLRSAKEAIQEGAEVDVVGLEARLRAEWQATLRQLKEEHLPLRRQCHRREELQRSYRGERLWAVQEELGETLRAMLGPAAGLVELYDQVWVCLGDDDYERGLVLGFGRGYSEALLDLVVHGRKL